MGGQNFWYNYSNWFVLKTYTWKVICMLFILSRYSKKNSLNRFVSKLIPSNLIINESRKIRLTITVYTYHYTSLFNLRGFNCFCLYMTTSIFVMICDVTSSINTNCADVICACRGISTIITVITFGIRFETISNSIKLSEQLLMAWRFYKN